MIKLVLPVMMLVDMVPIVDLTPLASMLPQDLALEIHRSCLAILQKCSQEWHLVILVVRFQAPPVVMIYRQKLHSNSWKRYVVVARYIASVI